MPSIASLFYVCLALAAFMVVAGEVMWRRRKARSDKSSLSSLLSSDDLRLEFLWALIPVFVLLCLFSVQMDKWGGGRTKPIGNNEQIVRN